MARTKSDELAQRFAERLEKSPERGLANAAPTAAPQRATSTHPSRGIAERRGRGASGTRLRGHLVPHALHADARRSKLAQQVRRGRRVTWDDVATEAIELLLADRADLPRRLTEVRRLADQATVTPRLVQASIPAELDIAFSELRLDLAEVIGRDVPYEQLWTAALLIWLRSYR
jgi:hypothetical protein